MMVGCKRFFSEYEERFNPADPNFGRGVLDKHQREIDVNKMVNTYVDGFLFKRLTKRAKSAQKGLIQSFTSTKVSSDQKKTTRRLSKAQLKLFREFFQNGNGAINIHPFQSCFEKFANGDLRADRSGIGEPNGILYLLFAEFAFLCIKLSISATTWSKILRTFVKTQEIFMHVYRPTPFSPPPKIGALVLLPRRNPRPLSRYSFRNFNGKGQSDLRRKRILRKKYNQLSNSELQEAARQNLWRIQFMP